MRQLLNRSFVFLLACLLPLASAIFLGASAIAIVSRGGSLLWCIAPALLGWAGARWVNYFSGLYAAGIEVAQNGDDYRATVSILSRTDQDDIGGDPFAAESVDTARQVTQPSAVAWRSMWAVSSTRK